MLDNIFHVLKLIIIGLILGSLVVLSSLKIHEKYLIDHNGPNRDFLRGEITAASALPLALHIAALPYGSDLTVYIDSEGGSVQTLNLLLTLVRFNNIHIHAVVVGSSLVASAAADFAAKADTAEFDPAALIVYHLGEICPVGEECRKLSIQDKDPMLQKIAESSAELVRVALKKCIITEEEFNRVLAGEDVMLIGAEANQNMQKCK